MAEVLCSISCHKEKTVSKCHLGRYHKDREVDHACVQVEAWSVQHSWDGGVLEIYQEPVWLEQLRVVGLGTVDHIRICAESCNTPSLVLFYSRLTF